MYIYTLLYIYINFTINNRQYPIYTQLVQVTSRSFLFTSLEEKDLRVRGPQRNLVADGEMGFLLAGLMEIIRTLGTLEQRR